MFCEHFKTQSHRLVGIFKVLRTDQSVVREGCNCSVLNCGSYLQLVGGTCWLVVTGDQLLLTALGLRHLKQCSQCHTVWCLPIGIHHECGSTAAGYHGSFCVCAQPMRDDVSYWLGAYTKWFLRYDFRWYSQLNYEILKQAPVSDTSLFSSYPVLKTQSNKFVVSNALTLKS